MPPEREAEEAAEAGSHALRVIAADPTLGLRLRAPAGPAREAWLAALRRILPAGTPWRRVPVGCSPVRLAGGIDLAASLSGGRIVADRGLLAEAAGGVLLLASAERVERGAAALLAQTLDGAAPTGPSGSAAEPRAGLIALDEGADASEAPPPALLERLAIHLDLPMAPVPASTRRDARTVGAARARVSQVTISAAAVEALCAAAAAFGIAGLAVPQHAVRVARVGAALAGRRRVGPGDVAWAARLCFGLRACVMPSAEPAPPRDVDQPSAPAQRRDDAGSDKPLPQGRDPDGTLEQVAIAAARSAVPDALRDAGGDAPSRRQALEGAGRGRSAVAAFRGRPVGSRAGSPKTSADVDLAATLQAAIPWQAVRGRPPGGRLRLRPEDLRIVRRQAPHPATTVFAVDASGSAAHGRLAEAKGAVELLLADCYVRRDEVALVAFRGTTADLLLPPTRSLARAKRELAELPGGGGTPLAAGLDLALTVANQAVRDGRDALIAVLTDGRGNVGRDGAADRARSDADCLAAAAAIRRAGMAAVVVDVSPRPGAAAARLAEAMAARYVALPHAAAQAIVAAVQPAGRVGS